MNIARDARGAAMVFGVFFAVFLIACVFALYGTIETVLYRQRVQDAADAAAFSAAVVNARGMNLIVLINMTMAVVLSIFVGLRLAQTVGYVSIGVCLALSSVTMGASTAAVPPLRSAVKGIETAAKKVKEPIEKILSVLHTLGKATSVIVPIGANVRVIDLVATRYDALGVAIPSRLTLPVVDDEFAVLCEHAARIAGDLAIAPISPIIPGAVEDALGDVLGTIAKAGSSWFCGGQGKPPDLNGNQRLRWIDLPRFQSQVECEAKAQSSADAQEDETGAEDSCNVARVELLASVPDREGRCRLDEDLCPTDCGSSPRKSCPAAEFGSCDAQQSTEIAEHARELIGSTTVRCGPDSHYQQRLQMARIQCLPESEGGQKGLSGMTWLQRTITREYRWERASQRWVENASAREEGTPQQVRNKNGDDPHPCGKGGTVGEAYEREMQHVVCESPAQCRGVAGPVGVESDGSCSRRPPGARGPTRFQEESRQVTQILRCAFSAPNPPVNTPAMDVSKEFTSGDGNTKPFKLEPNVLLGASDFQLRSVVIAKAAPSSAQHYVALASWDARADEQGGADVKALNALGRFGLAQAEYYFDWSGLGAGAPNDQTKPAHVTEWMWNMAWRARLRPFRLGHDKADSGQSGGSGGFDAEQSKFTSGQSSAHPKQELDCSKLGDGDLCGGAQQAIKLFGGDAP
jgi:hypothetical protein